MKKIFTLFLSILILSSCSEDYLTLEPQATLFSSNYFSTVDEVEQALIASYDVLGHQKGTGLAWSPTLVMSEILSDDAYAGGQDAGDGAEEDEFNRFRISTANDVVRSIWKRNYFGVFRANFTIEKAAALEGADPNEVDRLIAEAKFLRAWFNFELVRFFENVPLLTSVPSGLEDGNRKQSSPAEVYNQIATDLVDALPSLPTQIGTGRATKWAAQALLARVYLFEKGVYGNGMSAGNQTIDDAYVLAQLEDLIANSGHDLLPNYDELFLAANEFSIESVFEISYAGEPVGGDWGSEQYVEGNLAAQMMGPRVTGGSTFYRGWAFAIVSNKLYQDLQGDPRLDATIITQPQLLAESGVTLNTGSYQHTGYYNNKYTTRLVDRGTVGTPELHNMSNYRAIRYADVLLMAAELSQSVSYLNEVRNRVGLSALGSYSENALFQERRRELAGEGLRYFDLLRRGVTVAQQELSITNDIGSYYTGDPSVYEVTFDADTRGFLPIPQVEIDLSNGVLKQNDGY
ncbi:RagB/SusD family nutrient uptake outer membrane protein [Marinoscillum sp.]|uniref:RagB/SusD family nutrient uptake outer membrane protein n=1 Tax=Marinoscillum sp. TaxID=2024838 RepID=UPI003BAD3008